MHEISLVKNMFRALEEEFPGRLDSLRGIYLKVGLLSNVQPILMQNAFEAVMQQQNRYREVRLHVEVLPIKVFCESCEVESEVEQYRFVCARCGQPSTRVVQGDEMLITRVEFEEPAREIEQENSR
ncbi:MAG: hydrogenase maturation nickel metallochaperone HypA [Bacteroidota bacterium]|nr:hydrogenase maturation nickel metallochaperone HypA [Bacteroidota bacterium]